MSESTERQRAVMKTSRKQEQRVADSYKGSRQPRSGAGWIRKNDVRSANLLIECKFTGNQKTYTVKFTDLRDLEKTAIMEDRLPVLQFDLGGKNYVILTEDDFQEIIGDET